MASSTFVPNPVTNHTDRADRTRDSSKRRKRKKIQMQANANNRNSNNNNEQITQWKSEAQQQLYKSKLLQAIRHVRQSSSTSSNSTGSSTALNKTPGRGRAVREVADRVLAVTAKGRTRWSRAILTNKLKLKFMKSNRRQRGLVATATGNSRLKKPRVSILRLKTKNLPDVQRKARVLGGLVPGCRKQPLPVVLEEVTDYIPALEMQVKAMAALVELLSGGSGSISGSSSGDLGRLGLSRSTPGL